MTPITPRQWLAGAAIVFAVGTAQAQEISGTVTHVRDADTFEIGPTVVRVCGIDSPDKPAQAREAGRLWAKAEWLNARVTCFQTDTDRYQRAVARCFRAIDGIPSDLAWEAIRAGHAVQWAGYWRGCGYHEPLLSNARRD